MGTTTRYVPFDYRRVCDVCGNLRNISEMVERPGYEFVCSYHPGERTELELSTAIANTRPIVILPVPNPKPQNLYQPQNYEAYEAQIFNYVLREAPDLTAATPHRSAAGAAVYLADIITQGTRPAVWIASARTSLTACLTFLLSKQYGSPTGPTGTKDNPRYGGFLSGGLYTTITTSFAGLAFVKGYAATGNTDYLAAAGRCATFIRHVQCGDLQVTGYTVYPDGGGAYHVGGLASDVTDATGLLTNQYAVADIFALYFLKQLSAVVGPTATYGDAAATAFFSAATLATLATIMGELGTFASLGAKDQVRGGIITGLSATTPFQKYSAAINGTGGSATWQTNANTTGTINALGLRGVYEASGVTAQVTSVLTWLAAFTANPANATPSTNTAQQTLSSNTGAYDPTIAPATTLKTSAPFTEGAGALYDFSALGIMSPVLLAAGGTFKASLQASRDTLSNPQPYSVFNNYIGEKYLGPVGFSGLSLQPNGVPNVLSAARAGEIYRLAL
jgi:hypothetical protein